ncbi:MAG TPA: RHS repeat-associated core domain-containing protein [Terriglobales bacterium]|nr:RHS repeat-associated core domain-containing protein [Terriglobales bacterium]
MEGVRWGWLYQNGDGRYTLPDALGSTAVLAQDGTVQASRLYPFGEEAQATGAEYKWTNQIRDGKGLDHFAFRTYSSNLARWLSPDHAGLAAVNPADPASWNRYAYVGNQPLEFRDPLGFCDNCTNGYEFCPGGFCIGFVGATVFGDVGDLGPGGAGGMEWGHPKPYSDTKPDHPYLPGTGSFSGLATPSAHDPVAARLACAASWAQNHSLAALLGAQNTKLGRAVAGNSVAGLVDLGLAVAGQGPLNSPARVAAQVYGGGLGAGIPGAWSGAVGGRFFGPGAGGLARNAVTSAYVNVVTGSGDELITGITGAAADAASGASTLGEAAVPFVGWVKFGIDLATLAGGWFACR